MGHLNFDKLFELWEMTFYTTLLYVLSLSITLFISIKYSKYSRFTSLLIIYIIGSLILMLSTDLILISNPSFDKRILITETMNVGFATLEFTVFIIYFHRVFNSKTFKIISIISIISYTFLLYNFFINFYTHYAAKEKIMAAADKVIAFEFLILTGFCFAYFYKLLKNKENKSLLQTPSFWIITGLFFYCIMVLPFFLITAQLFTLSKVLYTSLFSVHYLFACIFLFSICKAILCKKELTI